MPRRFEGSDVIVTGASRGIGFEVASAFVREGAEVMLVGRDEERLDGAVAAIAASGGQAWPFVCDVSVPSAVDAAAAAAVERWGRIDVLVNNAGIGVEAPFLEVTDESWNEVVATNLHGAFYMAKRVCRVMAERSGGAVVNIASIDASGGDGPYVSYNAAKAGLLGLNRTMALELARYGIRVNAVSPGFTHTDMTESAVTPEVMDYLVNRFDRVPMRRLVRPEEVAAAVLFLASSEASAITGTNLTVDCGLTANWYVLETIPGATGSDEPAGAGRG